MIKNKREIWIRFLNEETFKKNRSELFSLLGGSPGECSVKVYLQDCNVAREFARWNFDENVVGMLAEVFGPENVVVQKRQVEAREESGGHNCCNYLERLADTLERIADILEGWQYGYE